MELKIIKLISNVDFYDEYNYLIDFNQYFNEGMPIFILSDDKYKFNLQQFKTMYRKLLDNIPNLSYQFDIYDNHELLKIKYYNKCNERLLNTVIETIKKQEVKVYTMDNVMVPIVNGIANFSFEHLRIYSVYLKSKGTRMFSKIKSDDEFKILFDKKDVAYISIDMIKNLDTEKYLRYDKDEDYWTMKKIKQVKKSEDSQLLMFRNELENMKLKFDLSSLRNINITDFSNSQEIQKRGLSDGAKYIYELFKKIFTFFHDNNEDIKQIVLDLQTVIVELKDMYAKLELKQNETEEKQQELYEKSLPKSEQKKLEEERKRKAEEERKLEEERQMKIEETKQAIETIKQLSAFCGSDLMNEPDMKDVLNMYGMIKDAENKKTEEVEESKENK